MRVYELAAELGVLSSVVLESLAAANRPVRSSSSSLDGDGLRLVREMLMSGSAGSGGGVDGAEGRISASRAVLLSEQAHVDRAYAALEGRLRESAHPAPASVASAPWVAVHLARNLERQHSAIGGALDMPLVMGRMTAAEIADDYDDLHVGRRAVHDAEHNLLVMNWAAPAAARFFNAAMAEPLGLRLRRRFVFTDGTGRRLAGLADERFDVPTQPPAGTAAAPAALADPAAMPDLDLATPDFVLQELARDRTGVMRDVLATIQRDQFACVTADDDRVLVVQGGPGTGKTAVGLPRAAWLLFNRPQLQRDGVLVVGPSQVYLRYIRQVLPNFDAAQAVEQDLPSVGSVAAEVTRADPSDVAAIKGDLRMAAVLKAATWRQIRRPLPRAFDIDGIRVELNLEQVTKLLEEAKKEAVTLAAVRHRYQAAISDLLATLGQTAARARGTRLNPAKIAAVTGGRSVQEMVNRITPVGGPRAILRRLLDDRGELAAAAAGTLGNEEVECLIAARGPGWTVADRALLDELHVLLGGSVDKFGHLVLDEAQDVTPMQARMLARRCPPGRATLLGDLAQATGPVSSAGWAPLVAAFGGRLDPRVVELTLGFRVPGRVLDLANCVLPEAMPHVSPAKSVRRGDCDPTFLFVPEREVPVRAAELASQLAAEGGTVGVIVPALLLSDVDAALCERLGQAGISYRDGTAGDLSSRVTLIRAKDAKGLEFDRSVVVEPAQIVAELGGPAGLRLLYVALTRCMQQLVVLHSGPLPGSISGGNPAGAAGMLLGRIQQLTADDVTLVEALINRLLPASPA